MERRHCVYATRAAGASIMVCLALLCVPAASVAADPATCPRKAPATTSELLARGAGYGQPRGRGARAGAATPAAGTWPPAGSGRRSLRAADRVGRRGRPARERAFGRRNRGTTDPSRAEHRDPAARSGRGLWAARWVASGACHPAVSAFGWSAAGPGGRSLRTPHAGCGRALPAHGRTGRERRAVDRYGPGPRRHRRRAGGISRSQRHARRPDAWPARQPSCKPGRRAQQEPTVPDGPQRAGRRVGPEQDTAIRTRRR